MKTLYIEVSSLERGSFMEKTKKKKFRIPSAFSILFILIIIVAIVTWLIPAGKYDVNESGQYIAGTYQVIESNPQSIWDIFLSPVYGMVGGEKNPLPAIGVAFFILMIGGFLGIVNKTGAINAGIKSIITKYEGKEQYLIPILMILFALGGSTYGMAEETMVFYPLLIPVMVSVGFDSLTAIAVILLGSGIGCLASTVNPFAVGIASDIAGINMAEGIGWRVLIFILTVGYTIWFVYDYAGKVKKDPKNSLVYDNLANDLEEFKVPEDIKPMNAKQKVVIRIFMVTFVLMIVGLIPWEKFGITIFTDINDVLANTPGLEIIFKHMTPIGQWYLDEITALFFVSALIIGVYYRFSEDEFISAFIAGCNDMTGVAIICAVSRGIQVVMNNGQITATVLHWGEGALQGLSQQVFITITYFFYCGMSFLISGSSSLAGSTMGLLGPLGEFAGVGADTVITAYHTALGIIGLITPSSVIMMAALSLAHIDVTVWWKFLRKFVVVIIAICLGVLILSTYF